LAARAAISCFGRPSISSTAPMLRSASKWGKRPVSWITYPIDRLKAIGSQSVVAFASTITFPAVGSIRRFTMRSSVVFPDPLRPSSAVVEPSQPARSMWSRMTRPSGVVSPT
jgi:hypothetical protein